MNLHDIYRKTVEGEVELDPGFLPEDRMKAIKNGTRWIIFYDERAGLCFDDYDAIDDEEESFFRNVLFMPCYDVSRIKVVELREEPHDQDQNRVDGADLEPSDGLHEGKPGL